MKKALAFLVFIAVAVALAQLPGGLMFPGPGGTAGINGFAGQKIITFDHTKTGTADSTSFPALISGTYTYLKTVGNGGSVTNASGFDIVYTSDSGCTTILPFERQAWSGVTGTGVIWVNVPTLSHTVDTVIYECYGKSAITTDQSNANGTWDTNFKAVVHVSAAGGTGCDGPLPCAVFGDSTSNSNTLTGVSHSLTSAPWYLAGTAPTGLPGSAGFGGPGNYAEKVSPSGFPTGTASRTMECWYKFNAGQASAFLTMGGWGTTNAAGNTYILAYYGTLEAKIDTEIFAATRAQSTQGYDSAWHYVGSTFSGTQLSGVQMYIDGAASTTTLTSGNFTLNTLAGLWDIGVDADGVQGNGMIGDTVEWRVSNVVRSASYFTATYNNVNSPSTFYTVTP